MPNKYRPVRAMKTPRRHSGRDLLLREEVVACPNTERLLTRSHIWRSWIRTKGLCRHWNCTSQLQHWRRSQRKFHNRNTMERLHFHLWIYRSKLFRQKHCSRSEERHSVRSLHRSSRRGRSHLTIKVRGDFLYHANFQRTIMFISITNGKRMNGNRLSFALHLR